MKLTNLFGKVLLVCVLLACKAGYSQTPTPRAAGPQIGPNEKVVRAYYTAFEKKDWNLLQQNLADGFTFSSPLDDHINIKAFKGRCWPNAYKIKRFDLVKVVINGEDAFVISNGWTTTGKLFRNCDYFKLKGGKISSDECFFGPGINYPNNSVK
ncbi:MAG TPA: nuclear transport factor 2 family protein [Chitinophagaceae bacterium]|nr:nuclear transport factor 2 family protein [Chitinophagaceae bacterium]